MLSATLASISKTALDILYPPRCALCSSFGEFLCAQCLNGLPRALGPRCEACWLPLWDNSCRACYEHEPSFSALRSAFRYAEDVRTLVHAFKYRGQSCLAPSLAAPMLDTYLDAGLQAEVVVSVPMTGIRRRQRGYNQAWLLARELGKALDLPVSDALRRRRFVGQQAKSRTAEQRRTNVEGAFAVAQPEGVYARRVLIVDDIATTGATLDACTRALLASGADDVVALTLARED